MSDAVPASYVLLIAFLLLVGCAPQAPPPQQDVRDPNVYAGYVKSRIVSYLEKAKRNPSSGQEQVGYVVSMLENSKSAPVGDNAALFAELLAAYQKLKATMESSAKGGQVNAEINAVIATAKKLPGELDVGADG